MHIMVSRGQPRPGIRNSSRDHPKYSFLVSEMFVGVSFALFKANDIVRIDRCFCEDFWCTKCAKSLFGEKIRRTLDYTPRKTSPRDWNIQIQTYSFLSLLLMVLSSAAEANIAQPERR